MDQVKEVIDEKKEKRQVMMQGIFLILLVIAICSLIATILTVFKYADEINNPLGKSLEKYNLNMCTCYGLDNKPIIIKSTNYSDDNELNYSFVGG